MEAGQLNTLQNVLYRIGASSMLLLLRSIRLSMIYVVIGVIIALSWLVVLLGHGTLMQADRPSHAASETHNEPIDSNGLNNSTSLQLENNQLTGGQQSMSTSVQSTDEGTTVTVNGDTQTVAPGQTFQQSYSSPDGNSQTDIQISGGTTTSGSSTTTSRSVHIQSHSSSQSGLSREP